MSWMRSRIAATVISPPVRSAFSTSDSTDFSRVRTCSMGL